MKSIASKPLTVYTIASYVLLTGIYIFLDPIEGLNKWPQFEKLIWFLHIVFCVSYPFAAVKSIKSNGPSTVLLTILFTILGIAWILLCLLLSFALLLELGGGFEMRL